MVYWMSMDILPGQMDLTKNTFYFVAARKLSYL